MQKQCNCKFNPNANPNFQSSKVRLNFGFGFGTERVDFNTFGIVSVSVESSRDTFRNISVSAAVMPNFGGHWKQVRLSDTVSRCRTIGRAAQQQLSRGTAPWSNYPSNVSSASTLSTTAERPSYSSYIGAELRQQHKRRGWSGLIYISPWLCRGAEWSGPVTARIVWLSWWYRVCRVIVYQTFLGCYTD